MKLEVLVDDRVFTPLSMNVELKQSVKVTAEAKVVHKRKGTSVSATVLNESIPSVAPKPVAPIQKPKKTPTKSAPKPARKINKNIASQRKKIQERRSAQSRSSSAPDKDLKNMLMQLFNKEDI